MHTCIQFQAPPAVGAQGFHRRFPSSSMHDHHHRQLQVKLSLIKPNNWESRRSVSICSGRVTTPVPVPESEKREFDESVFTVEEMSAIGKMRGKCNGGIAELLECLEKEAIMGEDDGKEPTDYSRRAMIFDKSSKVFQALKDGGCGSKLPVV